MDSVKLILTGKIDRIVHALKSIDILSRSGTHPTLFFHASSLKKQSRKIFQPHDKLWVDTSQFCAIAE